MQTTWTVRRTATAGMIMGILIAIVLVTALAPTIVTQSENARGEAMADRAPLDGLDNASAAPQAAPIFAMYPLFWAIVGLGVVAAAVIGATKVL